MKIRDSEQIRAQILEMHNQGYTESQMADVLGLSVASVHSRRKTMGLRRYGKKISDSERAQIKKMYRDGVGRQAIADHFGLARSSVNRVLRNSDITIKVVSGPRDITDILIDPINRFLSSTWTAENIRNCLE